VGDVQVGIAGELHPRSSEAMGVPERTCIMELDLSATMAAAPEVRPAPAVSGHPVAKEDIALVVDDSIPASTVQAAVAAGAGELLESIRLFDVYSGAQVPDGKRSLAFALRFRASDRTLSTAEIAASREGAIAEAARQCGATLR
jgi:phenylalanyl-tRNA synthetase beta chain